MLARPCPHEAALGYDVCSYFPNDMHIIFGVLPRHIYMALVCLLLSEVIFHSIQELDTQILIFKYGWVQ